MRGTLRKHSGGEAASIFLLTPRTKRIRSARAFGTVGARRMGARSRLICACAFSLPRAAECRS
jgi:hypothetical protein